MAEFKTLTASAVPLREENVDTDQIIPAKYLTAISKAGMGDGLFSSWRYNLDGGSPNPNFVLNKPQFKGAEILIAGTNFGSGSSREHAVWALTEYGFRSVITPKFADIFYNNSLKNGLLPVALPEAVVNELFAKVEANSAFKITVDLPSQTVSLESGESYPFEIDPFRKLCLLEGVDDLGYIMKKDDAILSFEASPKY
jgi:3-isopropylmalate/(R)-2-methylmalate dehydratase small subunit